MDPNSKRFVPPRPARPSRPAPATGVLPRIPVTAPITAPVTAPITVPISRSRRIGAMVGWWLLLIGCAGVLIGGCLPWYQVRIDFGSLYQEAMWTNGWDTWMGITSGVAALCGFVVLGIHLFRSVRSARLALATWVIFLLMGIVAFLGVLLALLSSLAQSVAHIAGITDGPSYGVYISLGAAIGICAGAILQGRAPGYLPQ